jgi:hypothetical protein
MQTPASTRQWLDCVHPGFVASSHASHQARMHVVQATQRPKCNQPLRPYCQHGRPASHLKTCADDIQCYPVAAPSPGSLSSKTCASGWGAPRSPLSCRETRGSAALRGSACAATRALSGTSITPCLSARPLKPPVRLSRTCSRPHDHACFQSEPGHLGGRKMHSGLHR